MSHTRRFTEEEYRFARYGSNALEYARDRGYNLVPSGTSFRLKEHDSMVFTKDGRWFWNSRGLRGGAIEFAISYEGLKLPEAVKSICNTGHIINPKSAEQNADAKATNDTENSKPKFVLPTRAVNQKELREYLLNKRGLDPEVVEPLVADDTIYVGIQRVVSASGKMYPKRNIVFVGKDQDGVARSAFQRGTDPEYPYKRDVIGSDPEYPFVIPARTENAQTAIVFEACIDALSHASIYKLAGLGTENLWRISINGTTKYIGLMKFLELHPDVKNIWIAYDVDAPGIKCGAMVKTYIEENFGLQRYRIKNIQSPTLFGKDWNDTLRQWRRAYKGLNWKERFPAKYGLIVDFGEDRRPKRVRKYDNRVDFLLDAQAEINYGKPIVVVPTEIPEYTPKKGRGKDNGKKDYRSAPNGKKHH